MSNAHALHRYLHLTTGNFVRKNLVLPVYASGNFTNDVSSKPGHIL
jgi:hypothetical protein